MTADTIRERVLDALATGPKSRGELLSWYVPGVHLAQLVPVLDALVAEGRIVEQRVQHHGKGPICLVYELAEAGVAT